MPIKPTAAQLAVRKDLCDRINQDHGQEDKPPFLPVDDKSFQSCSRALKNLLPNKYDHRDTAGRKLSLPSSVLPPPL